MAPQTVGVSCSWCTSARVIAVAVSLESILCGLARQCVNGLYEIVSRQGLEQYRLSFASRLYLVIDGLAQDETTQHIKGARIWNGDTL